ncbi:hypothetical protein SUGI_1158310 [Cryptomeria japonica]|uniref:zinc finger protein ZAT3 n=1 Tax=Cryptomeria japonica TaxID=3369 RepID=UPI00241497D9|nr:zinc finger protein ZAT3 [Cryptomeria japonica]GLJ54095.1 hypothetical protein SUGI_1158310 [Cryptomeria japonica]
MEESILQLGKSSNEQLALPLPLDDFDAAQILMTLATATTSAISSLFHIPNKPTKRKRKRNAKFHESSDSDQSEVERSYSCRKCSRKFSSFQALGGHRASCSKSCNGGQDMQEAEEHTPPNFQSFHGFKGICPNQESIKKAKVHKCPVCYKVFSCGQALGGHKRCHKTSISSVEATCSSLSSIEHQHIPPVKSVCLLDLNMLAPLDSEDEQEDSNGSCSQIVNYSLPHHYYQKFGMGPFHSRPE